MLDKRETPRQENRLFWVSLTLMVALIITQMVLIVSVEANALAGSRQWQSYVAYFVMVPAIAGNGISMWLSRRQSLTRAIISQHVGFYVTLFVLVTLFEGRGVVAALLVTAILVTVATYVLNDRRANRAIATAVTVGITAVLIDYFNPFTRLAVTDVPALGAYLIGSVAIIILLIIGFQYKTLNLRARLLLLFITVPAVIIAVVSLFFLVNLTNNLRTQIEADSVDELNTSRTQLLSFLNDASDDVIFLSQSSALHTYLDTLDDPFATNDQLAQARTNLNSEFFAFAQARLIYDQVRFLDITGQEIIRVNTTRNGISTIVPPENLQNKAGRYYFDDTIALSEGALMISPLDLNVEQGAIEEPYKPVIRYGTPVYSNGKIAGAIVTNILAENMLALLEDTSSVTYLVDSDGYYLYHPDSAKRWGRDLETGINLQQDAPIYAESLLANNSGTIEAENGDFYSHLPVTLQEENSPRWFLVSDTEAAVAFAPLEATLKPVQAIMALAIMLTPLVAIFVSASIATPLVQLSESAESIAAGNFQTTIDVHSEDEIGDLADAFRKMAGQLNDLVSSLEMKVTERTRDLTLAADIASNISQIRQLDSLLTSSVEIIRSRFDLYYTQVYLVNEFENRLELAAGTGSVGQELLRRNFALPLNFSSINGTVATEKRAVIVADTSKSPIFRPNPLLPDTRSEMSVPMIINDRVIGVLNVQSRQVNALSEANLPAFEAMASQFAVAIHNAQLIEEVMRTRVEMESHAQHLARQGWQNYLNAIERQETIGYRFANNRTEPIAELADEAAGAHAIEAPIDVIDSPIGVLRVKAENRSWNDDEAFIVNAIALQVGQRLENLRVLTEAEQYRLQAEMATQRMTRENWRDLLKLSDLRGFRYDGNEVSGLGGDVSLPESVDLSQALQVHGETIGSLDLVGVDVGDEEKRALVTAVSQQLSAHLENLRLTEQTQRALSETETLFRISSRLNGVAGMEDIVNTLVAELKSGSETTIVASLFTIESDVWGNPTGLEFIGTNDDMIRGMVGRRFDLEMMPASRLWVEDGRPILISDVASDPRLDDQTRALYLQINTMSSAILPLRLGSRWVGLINLSWVAAPMSFTESDEKLFQSVAAQLAVVLNSQMLFMATQRRAEREQLINTITQKIQRTTTMQGALETAVRELGQALHAKYTQVKIKPAVAPENGATNGHSNHK